MRPVNTGALSRACASIAPTWPLDRFIAVNPWWEQTGDPLPRVAERLASRSGATLLMPRQWFKEQWTTGAFTVAHLARAAALLGSTRTVAQLTALLDCDEPQSSRRARVLDVADQDRDATGGPSWRQFVTTHLSQFCASFFDDGQAALQPTRSEGLYATWRRHARHDATPRVVMGLTQFSGAVDLLPGDRDELIELALTDLQVPAAEQEAYASSLLLDLNGWASWGAYLGWTARLAGKKDDTVRELLALHLAWEWLVLQAGGEARLRDWQRAMRRWPECDASAQDARRDDWVVQRALELAWQERVVSSLGVTTAPRPSPEVQAVFCIDVRSEPFRRALEAEAASVQTLGFAGFFGLPIEYAAPGARDATPQLPGLLAPSLRVTDTGLDPTLGDQRRARLAHLGALRQWQSAASSSFSAVEGTGMSYALSLIEETLGRASPQTGLDVAARAPRVTSTVDGRALTLETQAALAAGVLRGMSLTSGFARLVVLVGHGSRSRNNPHAAGLDCGACCGQTGEVNARAAAALLNDAQVRAGLGALGIVVPAQTWFLAALHHTTTDETSLFELEAVPASHREDVERLQAWLAAAGDRVRAERAPRLGVTGSGAGLLASLRRRAGDWAQVRPEWGLADNAGFIVAPRELSVGVRFDGQVFLHEYRADEDAGFRVLEGILTAPMVVTHWINLQYYASTVDNARYGSGNKVLHNVVGGHLGVFEGNGGDLRVGLPMQSLHDGARWVHTPRRLSVFVAAPQGAIDGVLARHPRVRELVENQWLFLLHIDEATRAVSLREAGGWAPFGAPHSAGMRSSAR